MSQPLIRELAARLKVDEAQAAALLRGFVDQLRAEIDAAGGAVIPEIGHFEKSGDRLSFHPDPALSTAVNFRYAGLEPIEIEAQELPAAFEAPVGAPTQVEEDDDTPADADEWLEKAGVESEEERAGEDVFSEEDADDAPRLPDETVATWPEEAPEEHDGFPEVTSPEVDVPEVEAVPVDVVDEEDDPWADPRSSAEEEDEYSATVIDPRPERPPARRSTRTENQPDKEGKRPAPWIIAAIVVVMAGAAAFVLLRPGTAPDEVTFVVDSPPIAEQAGAREDDPSPDIASSTIDGTEIDATGGDVDEPAPAEQPTPTPEPATPQEPASPLRGDGIDRSVSRYTLVVGSLQSSAVAEEVAADWRGRGFRTDVFSETANGVTRYRVGVGQFESIDAADAARSGEIAPQLPEGTWVYRYPARSSE